MSNVKRAVISLTYEEYGPGKFSNNVEAYVYDASLEGFGDSIGRSDELGAYVFMDFEDVVEVDQNGKIWSFRYAILEETEQGFITVDYFEDQSKADKQWGVIEDAYEDFYLEQSSYDDED